MAFVYADRVKEQSSSVGVTPMVLSGALPGFQDFLTGVADANQTYYTIINVGDNTWEVGIGTYSAGPNSLSRDTVLASSNANAAVNFAGGTKTVFATVAAQFFGAALTAATHATLNHAGIPGVGGTETFTSADHQLVDHTALPFQLLDNAAHDAVDHTVPPLSLLNEPAHDALDHTGVPGVNDFDSAMHAVENHAGLPGVPGAETFTNAVHAVTDHALIPGVFALATHAATDHSGIPGVQAPLQFTTTTFSNTTANVTFGIGFTPFMLIVIYTSQFRDGGIGVAFSTNTNDQSCWSLDIGNNAFVDLYNGRVMSAGQNNPNDYIYTVTAFGGGTITLNRTGDNPAAQVSGRIFVVGS